MCSSVAALKIRIAISPRLATRTLLIFLNSIFLRALESKSIMNFIKGYVVSNKFDLIPN